MTPRYQLGAKVLVAAFLHKVDYKWERVELDQPVRGIVIGYRNRNHGSWAYEGGDWESGTPDYQVWTFGPSFVALDISTSLDRKYSIALPADVQPDLQP